MLKYSNFKKSREQMETLLLVAKYTLFGIFIFIGSTIITKSVGKFVDKMKKEDNERD